MQKYGTTIALAILLGLLALTIHDQIQQRAAEQALAGGNAEAFQLPVLGTHATTGPQDHEGKVILLDFWATFCEPCRDNMPDLQRLHERYNDSDFCLLSVNVDPSQPGTSRPRIIQRFVEEHELTFPVLLDYGPASEAYNVTSIPHLVLIDRDGKVRRVHLRPASFGELSREIDDLLEES